MSPEEKLEMGKKLIAEAEAEIAAKKRSWPEKIEPGMVFQSPATTATWMATDVDGLFVCLKGETGSFKAAGRTMRLNREGIPHASHARDLIKIADAAHEPTGAELVGKVCEFSDDGENWTRNAFECGGYIESNGNHRYAQGSAFAWKYARLAR